MIYVVTAIAGGWDNLRPPLLVPPIPTAEEGTRWICFTDLPIMPACAPWEFRPLLDVGSSSRNSRVPKILPHLMLPDDAEYSIWHDANFQLRMPPRQIVGECLRLEDWAAHRHSGRDCVYKEGEILDHLKRTKPKEWPNLDIALLAEEIASYRAMNYPPIIGLWENGLIIRRHSAKVAAVNEDWWKLFAAGCARDQLSFPVARWMRNLKVNAMPQLPDVYHSPFVHFNWHAAWRTQACNVSFWPQRDRLRESARRIEEVTGARIPYPEY